ncbi:pyrophosphatase PpaX [Radiobacillus kanasensis]|uniref:pyrophosphatase PpaX n=1 Tax=Radiobacillus kanasensis TaxID=2844358 RepID=UPI001E5C7D71|nr:pyrophosphatase PpaX [Radiobacillus kanasensis]UFT98505.1 pyrophosphatase PpaX [Radiobacillus kanasensis]
MDITTILFDLDGTLIDTNELIIASFQHTLSQHADREYSREEILNFIGPPLKDSFELVNPNEVDAMFTTYREHNLANHDDYVVIYPTVADTLKELKEKGLQLGIVTTKINATAWKGLKLTGIDSYFDVLIGLDDVQHAKPHPEPIVKALAKLGASASQTIMVGDNYHDVEAGKNAGTKTAGVAWAVKGRASLEAYKPDFMLEEMKDLLQIVGA